MRIHSFCCMTEALSFAWLFLCMLSSNTVILEYAIIGDVLMPLDGI